MSLVGNLEDLGLGEILQIVSLSRKSGVLSLFSQGKEGKIIFRQGQVIQAAMDGPRLHLGESLLKKGIIDENTLRKALSIQAGEGADERLGDILAKRFAVEAETIEEIVREQIERVVYSLFSWNEGSFDFELREDIDSLQLPERDPDQYLLERGMNPQFLAMEGSRILDETRHRGGQAEPEEGEESAEVSDSCDIAFDLMQSAAVQEAPAAESPEEVRMAVLTDDDEEVRAAIASILSGLGYQVHDFGKTEDALIQLDFLYRDGHRPAVLVDLIMPRMDGSGILGGLELLELIHDNFEGLNVIVLADHDAGTAEQKVRERGYPILSKPRKSQISDHDALGAFTERLRSRLDHHDRPEEGPYVAETINIGDELFREIGEDFVPLTAHSEHDQGMSQLRGMLEELNNPALGNDIILLVLRFAADFMNRAVIFTVRDDDIRGLGQFGIVDPDGLADARVRDLRFPVYGEPLFNSVIKSRMAGKAAPDGSSWNRYLLDQLGGGTPQEMFVGPIVSEGKVVALLYGDNLPEKRGIGLTDSLEIFLSQAGLAMEKALLQRKLSERGSEGT
ncbi:MAG: response regulator [Geobacteraceae bacterium]|nr:response regulator [Geobacteraceae bacterium]